MSAALPGSARTSPRAASCRTLRIARSSAAPWRAMPTVRSPKISIPTPRSAVWTVSASPVRRTIWTMRILRPFRTRRTFFRSIGVTFVKDGVTVETVEVPFGGKIASVPSVADKDGMYWQWNDFDPNEAVYYSRTVEGSISGRSQRSRPARTSHCSLRRALSATGRRFLLSPLCRMRKRSASMRRPFSRHTRCAFPAIPSPSPCACLPRRPGVSIHSRKGTLTPLSFTRDGSYIVFRLDNGASIVYLRRKPPVPAGSLAALRAAPQPPRRSS